MVDSFYGLDGQISEQLECGDNLESAVPAGASAAMDYKERHKFVGRSRQREDILNQTGNRLKIKPPPELRKWTGVLGLQGADFTPEDVHRAWRKQISSPQVHPDLGGEVESAILLNTAKDSLIKWLESFAPKLGKQFSHLAK